MFTVDEATAEAIRRAYDEGGELSGIVEFRWHFPLITDNAKAGECVRIIAGWKPQPDGLVDRVEDLGADPHVLRREPAADALGLKVGVQPAGEGVVLAGVADEARVVLDRLVEQRRQVFDQRIWQTHATQEGEQQR